MKINHLLLSFLFIFLSCSSSPKEQSLQLNAFPNAEFSQVIAYKMDGENHNIINRENKLTAHVVGKGVTMSVEQVDRLLAIFRDKETYGDDFFRCFEPHLGFVFYVNNDTPVAHATVCFECNWMRTSPDIGGFIFSKKGHLGLLKLEGDVFEL